MRTPRPALLPVLAIALLACATIAACSYSTKRLTAFPSARTIAVVPFENTGFRRELEMRLSMAVANEIRARTSLAPGLPETADLVLTGSMGADEFAIGLDENGAVIQKRLQGWLRFEVRDRASGRVVRRGTVQAVEEFRPGTAGESLAGSATDEWVRRIAERVVQSLESGF
jgi:hypothetical protein